MAIFFTSKGAEGSAPFFHSSLFLVQAPPDGEHNSAKSFTESGLAHVCVGWEEILLKPGLERCELTLPPGNRPLTPRPPRHGPWHS